MKISFVLTFLIVFGFSFCFGQVLDRAPSGRQNYLAVEGGGYRVQIDSTTSLHSLLARLSKDWDFVETGKGYWIGYTDDMFSIAARGDSAIEPLLQIAKDPSNNRARKGAIYSLHLIGINRTIVGREVEEFVNPKARLALLKLLKIPDLQETVMKLIMRDPWASDLSSIIETMEASTANCWVLTNGLTRYNIDNLPIHQPIPDNIRRITINTKRPGQKPSDDFDARMKEVLSCIKQSGNRLIAVEDSIFTSELDGFLINHYRNSVNIGYFFQDLNLENYTELGSSLQYYVEGGKLHICSPMTAQRRIVNWWKGLTPEQKALYNKGHQLSQVNFMK